MPSAGAFFFHIGQKIDSYNYSYYKLKNERVLSIRQNWPDSFIILQKHPLIWTTEFKMIHASLRMSHFVEFTNWHISFADWPVSPTSSYKWGATLTSTFNISCSIIR